jgi:hypothetical protein
LSNLPDRLPSAGDLTFSDAAKYDDVMIRLFGLIRNPDPSSVTVLLLSLCRCDELSLSLLSEIAYSELFVECSSLIEDFLGQPLSAIESEVLGSTQHHMRETIL